MITFSRLVVNINRHRERRKEMEIIGIVADIGIIIADIVLIAVIVRRWKN